MLPVSLQAQSAAPYYQQIIDQMRNLILAGRLPPGTALPSVRGLAQDLKVSVITTRRAYDELEKDGFIYTRAGMGSFVAELNQAKLDATRLEHIRSLLRQTLEEAKLLGVSTDQVIATIQELISVQ
jgi:GntR family transcriptional regulator